MARIRIGRNAGVTRYLAEKIRTPPIDADASMESEASMDVHFQAPGDPTSGLSFLDPGRDAGLIEPDQRPELDRRDVLLVDPMVDRPGLYLVLSTSERDV
jgi:hypothetical protein